jgi:hypothetical protein
MSTEQELLAQWRSLPKEKQEEVLDFIEFIHLKNSANKIPLGERLRRIREKIVASGKPLLDEDGIRKEIASRRGGLQEAQGSWDKFQQVLNKVPDVEPEDYDKLA